MTTTSMQPAAADKSHMRRVLFSSYLGSVVEFYDFLLYGIAASLVFAHIFFANMDPVVGTIASFGTLAAGYFSRPLGGIIFGHFGDKLGRKSMLVITMTLMGGASTLIGLLPTYDQIGSMAPILLVVLRLIQGVAVGGEWGGAALMSLEHASAKNRGLAASVANMGGPSGALLATLSMTAFSTLPKEDFLNWGWRVPFLFSAVLLLVGLFVRLRVSESPLFAAEKASAASKEKTGSPLVVVLRRYPKNVALATLGGSAAFLLQGLLATFAITLAVQSGADRTAVLLVHACATGLHIVTIPAFAILSDRIGRRPVMIGGAIAGALLAYPIFQMLGSGNLILVLLAFLIGNPLIQASMYGPMSAFISEMFGTGARYTGASLGYQLAATLGAGLAPLSAAGLLALGGGKDPVFVSLMVSAVCVISAVAIYLTRESFRSELGKEPTVPARAAAHIQ
ncbi:MHS family MFS transporter [Arthrobacter sp. PO-11]|uniref:MHS family MFS transporter n=2 Tax=Arthrobacter cavernae TaxID=2817681 RepID=A0A939KMH0_9MICC|nr:MHS family MFS transporter [Arthrobacter cavernae]